MGLVGRIANGALEGFVAGGSLGVAANGVAQGTYTWGVLPRSFANARVLNGPTTDFVKGGLAGAVVGGVLGALGNEHPVSSAVDGFFGGSAQQGKGTVSDVLAALAQHLRSA